MLAGPGALSAQPVDRRKCADLAVLPDMPSARLAPPRAETPPGGPVRVGPPHSGAGPVRRGASLNRAALQAVQAATETCTVPPHPRQGGNSEATDPTHGRVASPAPRGGRRAPRPGRRRQASPAPGGNNHFGTPARWSACTSSAKVEQECDCAAPAGQPGSASTPAKGGSLIEKHRVQNPNQQTLFLLIDRV